MLTIDLDARLEAARARLAAAKGAVTDKEREERVKRDEIAKLEAEAEEEERARLSYALDDRVEEARVSNPDRTFRGVMVQSFADTFIVVRNGAAHARWEAALRTATQGARKNVQPDTGPIHRRYAIDCIYDWNGQTNFDVGKEGTELSVKLAKYLTENPGLVTPLTDAAAELAGVLADQRTKSG